MYERHRSHLYFPHTGKSWLLIQPEFLKHYNAFTISFKQELPSAPSTRHQRKNEVEKLPGNFAPDTYLLM